MDKARKALESVMTNIDRSGGIIARIRAHIKKAPPRNDRLDINAVIREVVEFTLSSPVA